MNIDLGGKHVLVTGASKGIGLALARTLAAEGCNLHLAARDMERLGHVRDTLAKEFPDIEVRIYQADLSLPEDQKRLAQQCDFVDILVNNAGSAPAGDLAHTTDEVWRNAWDLKVYGYIMLTRYLFGAMQKRGSGVIANVIGYAGDRLQSKYIIGSTGNAALMAFTRSLGSQSTEFGVRVVGVNPSLTATERGQTMLKAWSEDKYGTPDRWKEFEASLGLPFGRMATVNEIADVVTFLVSPRASYISGAVLNVDGGAAYRNG